jgi:hypothetical protein
MSNNEKLVTWGLLGFIAWELWSSTGPAATIPGGTGIDTLGDNIPVWVKQLSRQSSDIDFFTRRRGFWGAC